MAQKYDAPNGPPPSYPNPPPQAHYDAGPVYGAPPGAARDYYGNYGPPQPQPQQGYYPPQGGMYYQQPQQYPQAYPPQQGGYVRPAGGRNSGAGEGLCAGLLAALTCCCCLDFLF